MKSPSIYSQNNTRGFTPSLRDRVVGLGQRISRHFVPRIETTEITDTRIFETCTTRSSSAGFTLIEILVVIGIFAIIASMGLAFGLDSYKGYLFRSEYTSVLHILSIARNRSVDNYNESAHGVKFLSDKYVLFTGTTYDASNPSNEDYEKGPSFTVTGIDTIVFKQLSGEIDTSHTSCSDSPCELTIADGGVKVQKFSIYTNGAIIQE